MKAYIMSLSDEQKDQYYKKKEEERIQKRKELRNESLKFFTDNTVHIDIVRNNALTTIDFPRLPFCK